MRLKKAFAITISAAILCAALAGCSGNKDADSSGATSETASSSSSTSEATDVTDDESLYEFPADANLSEDEMKATISAYADYMTQAMSGQGYTVTARFEDDGTVHYDGTRTDDAGNTDTITDLMTYDSVQDAFAYLYNCGQADAEGKLLVGVSEGVEEAVDEAASEGQEMAEEELAESEAASEAEGETVEGEEVPADDTTAEDEAASSEAEGEAPAEEDVASSEADAGDEAAAE